MAADHILERPHTSVASATTGIVTEGATEDAPIRKQLSFIDNSCVAVTHFDMVRYGSFA